MTFYFVLSVGGLVYGLAVNPEEDQLYISEYNEGKIVVTDLGGNLRKTLINCTDSPKGVTVDLNTR